MAETNNFSNINENFDTIKTLLNSIRAQGILNTSDVDKLLEGINSKLEKINTEEDIDLIKAFLTELKQNLDERHNVLISKFGAIESLFSNLLKNSSETVKSPELKELFDIVATNLSVFSREVVSQKEALTDITLRLDAMRSDDTQKKDIIKSVTSVRNDVEKLSNGFDSIVISLNENFKTVLKTISEIDQSEAIKTFETKLSDIINSSNTILSAIQLIDKKNVQIEDAFEGIARQEDTSNIQKAVVELSLKSQEIADLIDTLSQKSYKIDNLSDKIDAAVNIIAGLKTEISDSEDETKNAVLDKLSNLENVVRDVSTNSQFEEFKHSLEEFINNTNSYSTGIKDSINSVLTEIDKISEDIKTIDINVQFRNISQGVEKTLDNINRLNQDIKSLNIDSNIQHIAAGIVNTGEDIKEKFVTEADKLSQLMDINITRTLNDISSNAEVLNTRFKDSHTAIAELCERNFSEVSENISGLKSIVSQLDENNVSANNAIFSNITDRLAIFENSLKSSLEKQEDYVSKSSNSLIEQILNVKNAAENIDYKLDSSAIDIADSKREFEELKTSVNNMLALDFVNTVKDLKVDLYAAKQSLSDAIESSDSELSEKFTNDLFGKYELLISKLDNVEDEIKNAQEKALNDLKNVLNNISSSIVDILSYVSTSKETNYERLEAELDKVIESVQDSNLNYVENVRDVVDVIRAQVESNLKQIHEESDIRLSKITSAINESNSSIKQDLQKSYDKLMEVKDSYDSIKEVLNVNNITMTTNISDVLTASENIRQDFESKLTSLKNTLLDKVTEFKNEFTCENADKISELKFNSENLHSKSVQQSIDLKNELKSEISGIIDALRSNISNLNECIASTSLKIEGANKEIVNFIKNDFTSEVNNSVDTIKTNTADVLSEIEIKVADVVSGFNSLENSVNSLSNETTSALTGTLSKILENFTALNALMNSLNDKAIDKSKKISDDLKENFESLKLSFEENKDTTDRHLEHQTTLIDQNYSSLETLINTLDEQSKEEFKVAIEELNIEFNVLKRKFSEMDAAIDQDLAHQISIIEGSFESLNLMLVDIMNQATDSLGDKIKKELSGASDRMVDALAEELEQYKTQIEELYEELKSQNGEQSDFIKEKVVELNGILEATIESQNRNAVVQLDNIANNLREVLSENIELTSADYDTLKQKVDEFYNNILNSNNEMVRSIKVQLDDITKFIDSNLDIQSQQVNSYFEELTLDMQKIHASTIEFNEEFNSRLDLLQSTLDGLKEETALAMDEKSSTVVDSLASIIKDYSEGSAEAVNININDLKSTFEASSALIQNRLGTKAKDILDEIINLQSLQTEHNNSIRQVFENNIKPELNDLGNIIHNMFEENSISFVNQIGDINSRLSDEITSGILEFKASFEALNERLDKDELSRIDVYKAQIKELSADFNELIEESKALTKAEVASISEVLINNSKSGIENIEQSIEEKLENVFEQIDGIKQNSILCKDLISNLISEHFDTVTKNIEKETDVIIGDILEQFGILKDSQKDDLSVLTSTIEGSVAGYVIDAVNDLKSYLDVKDDSTVLNGKLDTLRSELQNSIEETTENINKLLGVSVFTDAITDLRATNQVLIDSMAEKLNTKVQDFIKENVSKKFDEKFSLFDKKFTDTVVDKYEEVKVLSAQFSKSFDKITVSIEEFASKLTDSKNDVNNNLTALLEGVNSSIDELKNSFADLKAQIMNKSFDEAFHASVHNQISGIENLVNEQLSYIEDISELCCSNLPELTEMNTIVKHSILQTVNQIRDRIDNQDINIPKELNQLKTDIITQFLNIFNQISFVAEQEEIIDFIDEKHSELITILSHIVNTVDGVETVKDNLAVVDNKMNSLKEDIDLINEKITAIMSSDGNIDYVYSLHDLESDIANLRLVLNEMKADNKTKEFDELINSTNNIHQLIESLSDDIVSISTRTNKLLLSSDESYKTLQDNLQDFKLVINDLDERTRNFSRDAGIEKIDSKLSYLNNMMQNGAKTNQVFNQVFEYLAEWVDKAGVQITAISNKVDTLDDIGQIKLMLEDLRAESQDNTESEELVNTLGDIFDKQAKRIASLEAKLDRMIVDSTINSRTHNVDLTPLEDTLNKFLAAIDGKMSSQQLKISSLEEKLEEVVSLVDNKDTEQLTKKVGGMDRQLAKLNKSIEKIASNVVEK